ncbi:hypothetical protein D3C79_853960 [compost metagenome]
MSDGTVGTGVGLAHEVVQVIFKIARLGVHFRVGGDFNVEVVSAFLTDELDQLVRVTQFAAGHAHARRQVTAQRDNALDAGSLVLGQQAAQVFLAVTDARQVRRGRYLHFAFQLQHGVERAVAGRATGTVGAGEEIRVVAGQLAGSGEQFFMSSIGLGREELEAVTTFLRHGEILVYRSSRPALKLAYRKKPVSLTATPALAHQ